jgi:hypothetical protein
MQDWVADYNGEGQEQVAREGGDSGVVMMAAVAEDGGGRRQWRQKMAAVDGNGGQRQQRTTKVADDDGTQDQRRTTRGKEESGRQTTTALGQPGRERETEIKKSSLRKKTFFRDTVCLVGVFAPAENQLSSFQIYYEYSNI